MRFIKSALANENFLSLIVYLLAPDLAGYTVMLSAVYR